MPLHLILARATNGVIGHQNQIPWQLPEDMAHFRQLTMGHPVIMGRKTWDSLPARFRPLPGRRNIVVTRQSDWQAEGTERAGSVDDALALCSGDAIGADDLLLDPSDIGEASHAAPETPGGAPLQDYLDRVERHVIEEALEKTGGNRTAAARALGVTFRSLRYRLERLGIKE